MVFFLQVVGGCLVALILFFLFVFVWLRWKIKSYVSNFVDELGSALEGMQSIPPMRLRLEQHPDTSWDNQSLIDEYEEALVAQGFEFIGDYEAINVVMDLEFFNLKAYCHAENRAYAVVYEAGSVGVWADIVARYTDGRRYCITSLPDHLMDSPENVTTDFEPEYLPAALMDAFFTRRPEGELEDVSGDQFVTDFQDAYAAVMDWRMQRGGPTAAEIERLADNNGEETNQEDIEFVQQQWMALYTEFLEHQLQENFLENSDLSAAAWEKLRDRVLFVHDRLTPDRIADMFEFSFKDYDQFDKQYDSIVERAGQQTPRLAFAELNTSLDLKQPLESYGQVSSPIEADVYLSPEEE